MKPSLCQEHLVERVKTVDPESAMNLKHEESSE